MEPVSIIVTAIVAAVAKLSEPAVKDAYDALKAIIKRKFTTEPMVSTALDKAENDPQKWSPTLQTALDEVKAGQDTEVVTAAEKLMTVLSKVSGAQGDTFANSGVKVTHSGQGNIVMGDNAGTTMDKSRTVINVGSNPLKPDKDKS